VFQVKPINTYLIFLLLGVLQENMMNLVKPVKFTDPIHTKVHMHGYVTMELL